MTDKSEKIVVVTGACGFIGSNLIKMLNEHGITKIVIVDDLTNGHKFKNLKGLKFSSYFDKDDFLDWFRNEGIFYENPRQQALDYMGFNEEDGELTFSGDDDEPFQSNIACVFHMGALSSTTEWDGKKMMKENTSWTVELLHICQMGRIPFIYASSASVYGNSKDGYDPLNIYAFSKMMIDQYVINFMEEKLKNGEDFSPIVGLRFFNVYGPNEDHKLEANQSSPIFKWIKELSDSKKADISSDYGLPEYSIEVFKEKSERDFVYVKDVCSVMLWFLENPCSGIFDVGTGTAKSFSMIASIIIDFLKGSAIAFIDMPENLKGYYQYHTQANLEPLRSVGCNHEFMSPFDGIKDMIRK